MKAILRSVRPSALNLDEIVRLTTQLDRVDVVMLGNFNPAIFRPEWLRKVDVARDAVASSQSMEPELKVIHPDVASFELPDRISVRVEASRFIATALGRPWIQVQDLVLRIFADTLPHTPLRAIGINRHLHFGMGSQAGVDRIGTALAPQDPWGKWGKKMNRPGARHGGMRELVMEVRDVDDRTEGYIQTKVEPSTRVKFGVYVFVNDHFGSSDANAEPDSVSVMSTLRDQFEASIQRSEEIIDQVMSLGDSSG